MLLLFLRALPMQREPLAMFVGEADPGPPSQFGAGGFAELRREARLAVVVEGDEGAVEGGVPECGEEEAVVDVEAFGVGLSQSAQG